MGVGVSQALVGRHRSLSVCTVHDRVGQREVSLERQDIISS